MADLAQPEVNGLERLRRNVALRRKEQRELSPTLKG